ncbi:MAG: FkbM family methyltransferase, partial [Verrucomicrobiae bacterium]|nr:FkbM family methyltransferase [Verrucomicrobiae bacterium]
MKLLLYRFLFRQQWLCKLLGAVTPPVLVRLPEFKIYVRLNDFGVGLPIFLRRAYEPYVTTAICRFLKPGCVFVDIGANIGYHTLMAAARVGAGGSVIAFEPNPANCALLQKSIAANGFGNIRVHPNAVADHEGDVGLTRDAMDS